MRLDHLRIYIPNVYILIIRLDVGIIPTVLCFSSSLYWWIIILCKPWLQLNNKVHTMGMCNEIKPRNSNTKSIWAACIYGGTRIHY